MHLPIALNAGFSEGPESEFAIGYVGHDVFAAVAPTHQVIDGTFVLKAELARHPLILANGDGGVNPED